MSIPVYLKESAEVLDFTGDPATNYLVPGDTITSSSWTVPSGITMNSSSFTTTKTTIWLQGGTDGIDYTLTNTIITAGGRTATRQMIIRCQFK